MSTQSVTVVTSEGNQTDHKPIQLTQETTSVFKSVLSATELYAQIMQTEDIGKIREATTALVNTFAGLRKEYQELYDLSKQVTQTANAYCFVPKEERKEENKKIHLKQLQELNSLIKLEKEAPTIATIVPNFLNSSDQLEKDLAKLEKELKETMEKAEDPNNPLKIHNVQAELGNKQRKYNQLIEQSQQMKIPLNSCTGQLDKIAETTRQHYADSLISSEVCSWELKRMELFSGVCAVLKELSENLTTLDASITKTKEYLRSHAYDTMDLAILKVFLCLKKGDSQTIESCKTVFQELLKEYPSTAASSPKTQLEALLNPKVDDKTAPKTVGEIKQQIETVLFQFPHSSFEEAKRRFLEIQNKYNSCLEIAKQWQKDVETEILELKNFQEKEKKLETEIEQIAFHNQTIVTGVKQHQNHSIEMIRREREALLYKLENLWNPIKGQLAVDSWSHLYYEINRLGYAIFEYQGVLPKDSFYKVPLTGWYVTEKYVQPLA